MMIKQLLLSLAVLFAINTSAQTSIIKNGDLTGDDMSSFQMKEYGVEPEVVKDAAVLRGGGPDGGNCVIVNSVAKVEYSWDSQFWIVFNGEIYSPAKMKIKFQYKASTKTHISTESHWNPGEYNSGSAIGTLGFTEEWQTFESIISVRPEMTRSDGGSGEVRGFKSIAFTLTKDIDITYYFANFEVSLLDDSPSDDDRTFQMSRVINGVEYALYKQVVDESDIHRNPDGWTSYRSELSLDVTKDGKKNTYIVDNDIYLDTQQGKNGQRPCMMFDLNKRQVYIFCNSKDADESVYSMDGFFYSSSLDKIDFNKELVYDYANCGWWPYFVESDDGSVVINHFSYAGYYNRTSKRDINGEWKTSWDYEIWPDDYIEQYFQNDEVLVVGTSPVTEVKLNKTKAVIEKGKTLTLKAKVYPTSEDQTVTWKSSDKTVATVTSAGKVKAVGAGTATITCTSKATGAKATCKVTVGYVKLSKTEVNLEKGKTLTLKSKVYPTTEDQSVTWESSDPTIVKVGSTGKIKGMKVGKAIVTCTSNATGLKATCEVTVGYVKLSDTELTIEKGKTKILKAKVYPTSEDQSVTWESSDPTIVKVASTGKIKGMKKGTAIITCTSNATGLSATCKVTVVKASSAPSLDDVTGIEEKPALAEEFDVYDLNGRRVLDKATSLEGLSNGVYIVNGKKVVKK